MTEGGPVRLRWRPFRLPMRSRFEAAHGAMADREGVLIELTDADGRRGVGEASPIPSFGMGSVADVIALIEAEPRALPARAAGLSGSGASSLRCALDVASLDLRARRLGVPVAACLGSVAAEAVPVNAVIGAGSPEEVARYGLEALAAGYAVLKLKVGVGALDEDMRRVAALREACPGARIRLDANGAWDEATALAAVAARAALAIELIEQPVAATDVAALARVREAASMPVAADEAVGDPALLDRVLEGRAADLVVLKPMVLGGLTPALAIARRAAEHGLGAFVTTTFDSSVGTAAALQLAAALPPTEGAPAHGLSTGEHLAADVTAATLVPAEGLLALPRTPGLGVEVDEGALDAVATGPWASVELA